VRKEEVYVRSVFRRGKIGPIQFGNRQKRGVGKCEEKLKEIFKPNVFIQESEGHALGAALFNDRRRTW